MPCVWHMVAVMVLNLTSTSGCLGYLMGEPPYKGPSQDSAHWWGWSFKMAAQVLWTSALTWVQGGMSQPKPSTCIERSMNRFA